MTSRKEQEGSFENRHPMDRRREFEKKNEGGAEAEGKEGEEVRKFYC